MKTILATATLLISLLGVRVTAAEPVPTPISVEQQFQQADVQLAIEQYKKLRMAAFDLALKAQTETGKSDEERKKIELIQNQLQEQAEQLRDITIKKAAVAVANAR